MATSETTFDKSVSLGEGALTVLPEVLAELSVLDLFLVLDEGAIQGAGVEDQLASLLEPFEVTTFSQFAPNPKLEDVERGVAAFCAAKAEAVVAFGGGTAIDVGKMIAATAADPGEARAVATGRTGIAGNVPPLVVMPTTAGTGSEATHFAVVYVDGRKHSVADERLLPTHAIVDPALTRSLPPRLTAACGLDAFCQAVESIWSVNATATSLADATEAARLAFGHLARAVHSPTPATRLAMCRAAHLAGRAINVTKTTLCHALSYPITSRWGVPHGEAVAVTLAPTLRFNADVSASDCVDPRGPEQVRERVSRVVEVLGADSVDGACRAIEQLVREVGAPVTARDEGLRSGDDVHAVVDAVDSGRLSNNPRRPTRADLIAILSGEQSG